MQVAEPATSPQEIAIQAHTVSTSLPRTPGRLRDSATSTFQDEWLKIINNADLFIITVMIAKEGRWVTVYQTHGTRTTRPEVYHPGLWTKHLDRLYQLALEAREWAENPERQRGHIPLDDSAKFPEYADGVQGKQDQNLQTLRDWTCLLRRLGAEIPVTSERPGRATVEITTTTTAYWVTVDWDVPGQREGRMNLTARQHGDGDGLESDLRDGDFSHETWELMTFDMIAHEAALMSTEE